MSEKYHGVDVDRLLDNAATASQVCELADDESVLREAVAAAICTAIDEALAHRGGVELPPALVCVHDSTGKGLCFACRDTVDREIAEAVKAAKAHIV